MLEILLFFSKINIDNEVTFNYPISDMQTVLAKNAADYPRQTPMSSQSVEEVANKFHVSQTHLQNAFKGVYGVTVHAYIRIQCMHNAASRLVHSNDPIISIAAECGYSNPSKFTSSFKRVMGETPSDYRKTHRIYHKSDTFSPQ